MTDEQLQRLRERLQSEDGRRAIREAKERADEMIQRLQEARKMTPELWDFRVTI